MGLSWWIMIIHIKKNPSASAIKHGNGKSAFMDPHRLFSQVPSGYLTVRHGKSPCY
jgi:hypothetical protein